MQNAIKQKKYDFQNTLLLKSNFVKKNRNYIILRFINFCFRSIYSAK